MADQDRKEPKLSEEIAQYFVSAARKSGYTAVLKPDKKTGVRTWSHISCQDIETDLMLATANTQFTTVLYVTMSGPSHMGKFYELALNGAGKALARAGADSYTVDASPDSATLQVRIPSEDTELQVADKKRTALTLLNVFKFGKTAKTKTAKDGDRLAPKVTGLSTTTEALLNKVEDYLQRHVDDAIMTKRAWSIFRRIKNEHKVSLIPQLITMLAEGGVNPQDNAVPVFRDLRKLQLALENEDVVVDSAPSDRERIRKAKEVEAFLKRLAIGNDAPLRGIAEQLNGLDLRGEAKRVLEFMRDAASINNTLNRVVIQG